MMKTERKRIDVLLVEQGHANSREQAKKMIISGCVFHNDQKVNKTSQIGYASDQIEVRNYQKEFVSRGGYKLKKAIECFDLNLKDKVAADIGASTGGFTDCMLQNGVKKVFAVDAGYGQLDWKLRNDDRVISLERCNARFLTLETFKEKVDFVTIDVSFISLKLIFPVICNISKQKCDIVCLIKPQFEAGRNKVGKNGVVRDIDVHKEVIQDVITYAQQNNLNALYLNYSPIKGPKGNIEYLLYLSNDKNSKEIHINDVVDKAWSTL